MMRILYFVICMFAAHSAVAQTSVNLGGLSADPSAAVEIAADSLAVDQASGAAVFEGNVVVGQGALRLSAGRVRVVYDDATGDIANLEASGGVTFVTDTEAAEALTANYDLGNGQLILTGDVLLTQGASAISADEMIINLETGNAQMNGRVRTVFSQGASE